MWTSPKPIIAPFASGPGIRTPGVQVGWMSRPIEPGSVARTRSSNSASGAIPSASAWATSARAELALEPVDQPVAAVDLDLEAVRAGDGGGIRRDERDGLDVAALGRVDRRRRAVRQRPDVRRRARPEPRTSQALSAAAAMTGSPGGQARRPRRPRPSARRAARPAGRAPAARRGRSGPPASASRRASPRPAACSRTAGSRPGAATESTNRPVRRWARKPDSSR